MKNSVKDDEVEKQEHQYKSAVNQTARTEADREDNFLPHALHSTLQSGVYSSSGLRVEPTHTQTLSQSVDCVVPSVVGDGNKVFSV